MHRRLPLLLTLLQLPWLLGPTCTTAPLLPPLAASEPTQGAVVARSAWLVLDFAAALGSQPGLRAVLACDDVFLPTFARALDADTLVLQPRQPLPAGAACELSLGTTAGTQTVGFQTLAAGAAFTARFDRTAPDQPLPFPDDLYLVPEPANPTGWALDLSLPNATSTALFLLNNLAGVAESQADGWSPIGPLAVQLSTPADGASLPLGRAASLDPLSTLALIDMTPGSARFGERVPFNLIPRSDTFAPDPTVHALVLFPGIPLEPEGTYGLVVTDRVLEAAGEPLARSAFFAAATGPAVAGEAPEVTATRPLVDDVLSVAESLSPLPIPRDDVVLATRVTIRSTDHFPDDLLAMRADVLATPPNVQITGVASDGDPDVSAVVTGTFDVPLWLDTSVFLTRGPDGLPVALGTRSLDFILALPAAAASGGHAPLLLYQHGNPGSAEGEVPSAARAFLGGAGFAVAGFTDALNRLFPDVNAQTLAILGQVLGNGEAPDFYVQTYAEQMAFVQALQSLTSLDQVGGAGAAPGGGPDGVPDVDPSRLVYEGISYGSTHGQALLAYEPAIRGAGLVVGALRFTELLEHQDRTLPLGGAPLLKVQLPGAIPGLRVADLWFGLQLFALTYDRQDPHNHARFIYREPLEVDGTTQKASILVVEGIDDSFTANTATRSLARQLGIPQLEPAPLPQPDLAQQAGPIQGNVDAATTAALVQYVPWGAEVPPSPGCELQPEGHFCAQTSPAARAQRVDFYQSALTGVPVID